MNARLAAAVGFALLAAAAGALAWGLQEPGIGAAAAATGVIAATVASLGFAGASEEAPRGGPPTEPDRDAAESSSVGSLDASDDPSPATEPSAADDLASEVEAEPVPSAAESAGELVDEITGMLDHRYFLVALERRVAASRRKLSPFSLVVLELRPEDPRRHRVTDQSIRVLAAVCRAVLREADTGCRIDEHTIGLLLEDTPEAGAVWATERVRAGFFATTFRGNVKLAAGIAAYPAHALEPDRLFGAARDAARRSRELGDESIQLASPDESASSQEG